MASPRARQRPLQFVQPRVELQPTVLFCRERVGEFTLFISKLLFETLLPHQPIFDIGQFEFELACSVSGEVAGANPLFDI